MKERKTYLITGVAGFIGSATARSLLEAGHTVIGIDNLLTGLMSNVPSGVQFFKLDITKPEQLDQLNGCAIDVVLHFAAQTSGEISFENPANDLFINALGTLNMLRYCEKRNILRFVYTSSATVYGDPQVNPIPITHPTTPKSYYGVTKLTGEHYVRIFSKHIHTTTLRLFNVYGPGQNLENIKQGMVSIYLYYLVHNEPIIVKGSGERFRDFIYIDDVVSGILATVDAPITFHKTYNVASGEKTTVARLLTILKEQWGSPEHQVSYTDGTPGDAFGSQADIEPIKNDLGWEPKIDLQQGIKKTIDWSQNLKNSE